MIGGSIGLALRQRKLAQRVIGIGRDPERLQLATECGAVTQVTTDLEQGVADANLTVVCSPVETIPDLVARVGAAC